MSGPIFDPALLSLRMERARRMGGDRFLEARAFEECLERIAAVRRPFRSALIYGRVEPDWPRQLTSLGIGEVATIEPGADAPLPPEPDLCLTIGALDTAEPLHGILGALRETLAPDGLLIGAIIGGDSFPALRSAMQAADGSDVAAAHIHPRIAPAGMAALLTDAGFKMPVVDVDRIRLRYDRLDDLIRDLRGMAATNRLLVRPRRPIMQRGLRAARVSFADRAEQGRTTEIIELIHFAAWTPAVKNGGN